MIDPGVGGMKTRATHIFADATEIVSSVGLGESTSVRGPSSITAVRVIVIHKADRLCRLESWFGIARLVTTRDAVSQAGSSRRFLSLDLTRETRIRMATRRQYEVRAFSTASITVQVRLISCNVVHPLAPA